MRRTSNKKFSWKMYSYEKATLISCRNIEVVFSYAFYLYVFFLFLREL